jgi:hypothetical protein
MKIKNLSEQFDLGFVEIDDELGTCFFKELHANQLVARDDFL